MREAAWLWSRDARAGRTPYKLDEAASPLINTSFFYVTFALTFADVNEKNCCVTVKVFIRKTFLMSCFSQSV